MEFLCKLLHTRKYIFLKPICYANTRTGVVSVCVRAFVNKRANIHTQNLHISVNYF